MTRREGLLVGIAAWGWAIVIAATTTAGLAQSDNNSDVLLAWGLGGLALAMIVHVASNEYIFRREEKQRLAMERRFLAEFGSGHVTVLDDGPTITLGSDTAQFHEDLTEVRRLIDGVAEGWVE